ncbi:MAG: ArnT family glycosyltransferase, partial [Cytophagaceae bacterium]
MQKYLLSAQNVSWLIFSLIAAFVLIFWFAGFDGFYFYDDYQYSLDAFLFFKEKSVSSNDIFSHRLMVYIPVAIAYLLFGVNEFSTVLWPLLVSLASLWLVFFILRGKPWQPASIVLMGLSFYPLFFCNKLYPDSIVSFFCFLSVCILYKADEKKYFVTALAFALAVFCAFLSKETVIYFFPFYLILFISDLRRGYNKKFWVWTFVWTLSLSVIYFAFYKILTGSFFTRFYAIENGHYAFPLSYYS